MLYKEFFSNPWLSPRFADDTRLTNPGNGQSTSQHDHDHAYYIDPRLDAKVSNACSNITADLRAFPYPSESLR